MWNGIPCMGQSPQTDRVGITGHDTASFVEVSYQPNRPEPTEPKPERETFGARVVETQHGTVDSELVVGLHVVDGDGAKYRIMRGGAISRFGSDFEHSIGYSARVDGGGA